MSRVLPERLTSSTMRMRFLSRVLGVCIMSVGVSLPVRPFSK